MEESKLMSEVAEFLQLYSTLNHDDRQQLKGVLVGIKMARETAKKPKTPA